MVGVAGKSKACRACKRRKMKCDLTQPECLNCVKTGKRCEYGPANVFLTTTQAGFLDNTASGSQVAAIIAACDEQGRRSTQRRSTALSSTAGSNEGDVSPQLSRRTSAELRTQIDLAGPMRSGLEAAWVDLLRPKSIKAGESSVGDWVVQCINTTNRTKAFDEALMALTCTRVGRSRSDTAMISSGLATYGRALKSLQTALWQSDLIFDDGTLAACQILKTFELEESTFNNASGYNGHVKGLVRLLELRGPELCYSSQLSHIVTTEVRYAAMIEALVTRKNSPLGDTQWQQPHWTCATDVEQALLDKGFEMANVLETMELIPLYDAATRQSTIENCSKDLMEVEDHLKDWHGQLLQKVSLAFPWRNPELGKDEQQRATESEELPREIKIDRLRQGVLMNHYWTLILFICMARTILSNHNKAGPPFPAGPTHDPMQLIKNITHMVPELISEEDGCMSAPRCILPLRQAMGFASAMARFIPDAKDLEAECARLLTEVAERKGVRHANAVLKMRTEMGERVGRGQATSLA